MFSRFYQRFGEDRKAFTSQNRNNEYILQPPTTLLDLFPSILSPLCSADSPAPPSRPIPSNIDVV